MLALLCFLLLPVAGDGGVVAASMPSSSSFIETRLLLPAAQADGGHGLTHRESHLQANAEEAQDDISKHISHHNSI